MQLNSKDIFIALKLASDSDRTLTQAQMAYELGLAQSQVNLSLVKLERARLYNKASRRVSHGALLELLIYGIKYIFPAQRGELTRGVVTPYAAPPLNALIRQPDELPPVWPTANGMVRGYSFEPLDAHVPEAALRDPRLYELLALVDALRDGRARESVHAIEALKERL